MSGEGRRRRLAALADGGSEEWHELLRRLLWLALALLALGFVAAALVRRLNFDEALALRGGWLAVQGLPAAPPFYMPATWLLGLLGSALADPGAVLLLARAAVLLTVGPALLWGLGACGHRPTAALAAVLLLSQATFVVHGLEFRYDWALLVAWPLGYRLIVRRRRRDFLWLGLLAAWLAAHHLKGLYLAICLLTLAGLAAGSGDGRRRRLAELAAGAGGGLLAWVGLSVLLGHGGRLAEVYTTFFGLATGAEARLAPWESLGGTFRRDAVWWLGALLATIATVWRLPRSRRALLAERDAWTLAFALAPLGFLFLHPHPWAYMLVLPAPFLSLLMAERLAAAAPRPRPVLVAGAAFLVLLVQWGATRASPWQEYFEALSAPRAPQVATLRLLRERAVAGDRILDPSGLAYFVEPCIAEWYLDTLFQEAAERGEWMTGLGRVDLTGCPWMLNTYRLRMLPSGLKAGLAGAYVLIEGGGGLALHVDDPRLAAAESWPELPHRELFSFW